MAQEQVKMIKAVLLLMGNLLEMVDENHEIVSYRSHTLRFVRILTRELLKLSASVALCSHSKSMVEVFPNEPDSSISLLSQPAKPYIT